MPLFKLIEQEAVELKNKFATARRSILEDAGSGEVEDIDVIPNEEMILVATLEILLLLFFAIVFSVL